MESHQTPPTAPPHQGSSAAEGQERDKDSYSEDKVASHSEDPVRDPHDGEIGLGNDRRRERLDAFYFGRRIRASSQWNFGGGFSRRNALEKNPFQKGLIDLISRESS